MFNETKKWDVKIKSLDVDNETFKVQNKFNSHV